MGVQRVVTVPGLLRLSRSTDPLSEVRRRNRTVAERPFLARCNLLPRELLVLPAAVALLPLSPFPRQLWKGAFRGIVSHRGKLIVAGCTGHCLNALDGLATGTVRMAAAVPEVVVEHDGLFNVPRCLTDGGMAGRAARNHKASHFVAPYSRRP